MNVILKNKKYLQIVLFLCGGLIVVFLSYFIYSYTTYLSSRANFSDILDTSSLSPNSVVKDEDSVVHFSLYKDQGFLYKTKGEGSAAALEFMDENPQMRDQDQQSGLSLFDILGYRPSGQSLLPPNLIADSTLIRSKDDRTDPYLVGNGFILAANHYFYNQTVNDIPVYGAVFGLHIKNENEIYAIDGSLLKNTDIGQEHITQSAAENIALLEGQKEASLGAQLVIADSKKYIYNKKLLGISDDSHNYIALSVIVSKRGIIKTFSTRYMVNLEDGEIIFKESLIDTALNRIIYDYTYCEDPYDITTCRILRQEGQSPSGDLETDAIFDFFGDIYNYYKNNFNRDSVDNNGLPLIAFPHFSEPGLCPNAFWSGPPENLMVFCDGLATKDITAHEITHGVTQFTAQLGHQYQSGALNESVSDIFAYALDPDWTLGEDSSIGTIRRIDDPTQSPNPQPDRLFSENYLCPAPGESCGNTNDDCGTHINNGVMNKAFYLMTAGGSFNGCTINPIGPDKSNPIVYRALTTYLTQTSNFKTMYNALLRSCDDLFGPGANECGQVKSAMQATEMDQQPDNQQNGAQCLNVARQTPECALPPGLATPTSSGPTPTGIITPIPTNTPIETPIPSPTTVPPTPLPPVSCQPPPALPTVIGGVIASFTIKLPGVGDNGGPGRCQRAIEIQVLDQTSQQVGPDKIGTISYDPSNKSFTGQVFLGSDISQGFYTIKIKTEGYLRKLIPGFFSLGPDTNIQTPPTTLVTGDIIADNVLNIQDFNSIVGCYNQSATGMCQNADLDDNGIIDGVDINLFIRSLATRNGD